MLDNLEINFFKKNRGLFVFSDPGGAKPLLSFIFNNKLKNYKVVSDRKYNFFLDFKINVNEFLNSNEKKIIKDFNPDYLITGTSYTSKIELRFIKAAKELNIKTYSYIDHYTNFKERFLLNENYNYPDNIILIDDKAEKIAKKNELDKFSKLLVMKNFYLDFLQQWEPFVSKIFLKNKLNISENDKIILFAPDPLSNINGKENYKFDEKDVLDIVINSLKKMKIINYKLIIKLHPNQNRGYLLSNIANTDYVVFENNISSIDLIYFSDIIIGMFSSILIEAKVFKKTIIRYFPASNSLDPLDRMNVGVKVKNSSDFYLKLKENMSY
jgi:CDP-glycerol glycerophosphotransferase (TagB/SpsB family)